MKDRCEYKNSVKTLIIILVYLARDFMPKIPCRFESKKKKKSLSSLKEVIYQANFGSQFKSMIVNWIKC